MYLFEGLKNKLTAYLNTDKVNLIQHAYVVARDAHDGQMRSSGDPYITHPIAVAVLMAEMRLDHETVMAALLHDVIEDTPIERQSLVDLFGETVADLVDGVSKLDKISFSSKEEAQAENFRKMMMAMVQDVRVILIKLADRTHNMRTLGALRPDKRRRIARETLEIYAPIAHRLGIHDIKNELEDLGFQAMYPMRHRALGQAVREARGNRKHIVEGTQRDIEETLKARGLRALIKGREKHLYSIYRKMRNKELMFNEVMDIYAFRLVLDDVDNCYRALGVTHGLFKPVEERFKDYIAIPRTNGYQSLHTSLVGPHGIPIEIQIRTHEMDHMADKGIAAHWAYKDTEETSTDTNMAQSRVSKWTQSLLELQQNASSSFEFIENVKTDLFPDEIYVFTPDGRIVELPMGATPVDFAYAVHTAIGNTCVGARVDRRAFSLSRPLENGQSVEIVTSPNAKPNANWLNFIVSARARSHVRQYLRKQRAEEALCMGSRLLRHALSMEVYDNLSADEKQRVAEETNHDSFEHLLSEIGLGNEMSGIVARRFLKVDDSGQVKTFDGDANRRISVRGTDGLLVTFARCCYPIPGDHISSLLSPGKGMVIHQSGCSNIKRMAKEEPQRVLPMEWEANTEGDYKASVKIELMHHQGVLAAITQVIASCDSNVIGFQTEEKEHNIYFIEIELLVRDRVHLATITKRIRVMDEVLKVSRHSQLNPV